MGLDFGDARRCLRRFERRAHVCVDACQLLTSRRVPRKTGATTVPRGAGSAISVPNFKAVREREKRQFGGILRRTSIVIVPRPPPGEAQDGSCRHQERDGHRSELRVSPDRAADPRGGLDPHGVDDVLVAGEEHGLAPTHEAHNDAAVDALSEEDGCGGMAGVVQSGVSDASTREECLPGPVVAARVGRRAVGSGKDEVEVLPS